MSRFMVSKRSLTSLNRWFMSRFMVSKRSSTFSKWVLFSVFCSLNAAASLRLLVSTSPTSVTAMPSSAAIVCASVSCMAWILSLRESYRMAWLWVHFHGRRHPSASFQSICGRRLGFGVSCNMMDICPLFDGCMAMTIRQLLAIPGFDLRLINNGDHGS